MTEPAVRLASWADEAGVMQHIRMIHDENGLYPLSEPKARRVIGDVFDRKGGIVGVIGDGPEFEASICLTLQQPYYSDAWQLVELWNFVAQPRARRAGHAKKLIEFAKLCSDSMKLPLTIGILSNQRIEAKKRLYERQLEAAGVFFFHNRQYAGPSAWDKAH